MNLKNILDLNTDQEKVVKQAARGCYYPKKTDGREHAMALIIEALVLLAGDDYYSLEKMEERIQTALQARPVVNICFSCDHLSNCQGPTIYCHEYAREALCKE